MPNAQFDPAYYLSNNADLAAIPFDAAEALVHYFQFGINEGRIPSQEFEGFNAQVYFDRNPDVAAAFGDSAIAALAHFVHLGSFEGRIAYYGAASDYTTGAQLAKALEVLPQIGAAAFDANFYTQQYLSDYTGGLSAIEHFVQIGASEGFQPNRFFDPAYYISKNPDLGLAGIDKIEALVHFAQFGINEGRPPSRLLESFDGEFYLTNNPDVAAAGAPALAHYLQFGFIEGRIPSSLLSTFNSAAYLDLYPDVEAAGVSAFAHYLQFGLGEGRFGTFNPVGNSDSLEAIEDTQAIFSAQQLLGNDTDLSNTFGPANTDLTIKSVVNGVGGVVVLNSDGTVTFTPSANFNGPASFTYVVTDGLLDSVPTTVSVLVSSVNDDPTVTAFIDGALVEDESLETLSTTVSVNFNDVDLTDVLGYSFAATSTNTLGGMLTLLASNDSGTTGAAGSVSYTYSVANSATQYLAFNQVATESFTITANDANGGTVSQVVTITITGTNDVPTIDGATNPAAIAEIAGDSSAQDILTVDGTISITDQDLGDTLTVTVTGDATASYSGGEDGAVPEEDSVTLTSLIASGAITFDEAISNGELSVIDWHYNPEAADLDWLRDGETLTLTYVAQVDDGAGNVGEQALVITITGTNDVPTIETAAVGYEVSGTVTEIADLAMGENTLPLSDAGAVTFSDVDLGDLHNATFAQQSFVSTAPTYTAAVGTFALGILDQTANSVGWTFTVNDNVLDNLAAGETLTQVYRVTVSDDSGTTNASVTQDVTVTITGTNDRPVIETAAAGYEVSGTVTEIADLEMGENTLLLSDAGAVTFSDVDLSDLHNATFAPQSFVSTAATYTAAVGTFALGILDQTANSVGWTFTVNDNVLDNLAAGETLTQVYRVTVSDDSSTTNASVTQDVTVTITGKNDGVTINEASTTVSASAERTFLENGVASIYSGRIAFTDVDLSDTHVVSSTSSAVSSTRGDLGSELRYGNFVLGGSDEAANSANGRVGLFYAFDPDSTNELANGEVVTETYTVTIDDQNGSTVSRALVIRIVGTEDDPTVTAFIDGAVVEDESLETLSTTVSVNFNDVDLTDVLGYSFAAASTNTLGGMLTLLASNDSGTTGAAGSVSYTYSVANSATQYLAFNQVATESFTITANDANGGTVSQVVTVTVTGTNDMPTVAEFTNGALTEDATIPTLSTTVSVNFNDVDLTDVLGYSFAATSTNTLGGMLTLLASNDSGTTGAAGSVSYTYSVANSATQYLAFNQVATESFTVTANDANGGTVSQVVTVTVTGTNDAPVITTAMGGNRDSVIEAGNQDDGTVVAGDPDASGTLAFSDVDNIVMDNARWSGNAVGTYGAFAIDPTSGAWTFALDQAAADFLAFGESVTEDFVATVTDEFGATAEQTVTITINGTNDFILGTPGPDTIQAGDGSGNDALSGLGGDDILNGRLGNDTLVGGDGNDQLVGNQGNDSLFGGNGDDELFGGRDNDSLFGGNGNDTLNANEGMDFVNAGAGKDLVYLFENTAVRDQLQVVDGESATDNFDEVTDFAIDTDGDSLLATSADTIDFGSAVLSAVNVTSGVVSGELASVVAAQASLNAALTLIESNFQAQADQQVGTVAFAYGGVTYLGEVSGAEGMETFTDVVRLVGVQGVTQLIDADGIGAGTAVGLIGLIG